MEKPVIQPFLGRLFSLSLVRRFFVGAMAYLLTFSALANPIVDHVGAGNVTIQQAPNSTVINQTSQKGIINWHSFNIGAGESTHFQQPAGGITLNRINPSQGVSSIYGHLTATGQIILINPAGIYFGPSAYVNVGGLIATTHNMSDTDFLSGNFVFNKVDPYSGSIVNEGTIIAAQHGLIALVAPSVVNNGMIQADTGKVILASGNAFTMSFDGNGLVNFVVDQQTTQRGVDRNGNQLADGVKNTGSIIANGGSILITAKAASGVLDNVINMEGITQAQSVGVVKGEIILSAETDINNDNVVRLAGGLDASGKNAGEKGGNITVTSKYILADNGANIDVSGDAGGGNVRIGGNYLGQGPLPNATALVMSPDTIISADALSNGNGGEVILWSNNYTNANGSVSVKGGLLSGNGGFVESSSKNTLVVGDFQVDASAPAGNAGLWLLDPYDVTIYTDAQSGGSFSGGNPNIWTPTANDSHILVTTLESNLATANVTINTTGAGAETGNINIYSTIDWSAATTLTLNPQAAGVVQLIGGLRAINGTGASSAVVINGKVAASPFGGSNSSSIWAHGGITITGAIDTGGTGIELASNSNLTISSLISGSGYFRKDGTGIMTLSNASNSYTGGTYVDDGTVRVGVAGAIPNTGAVGGFGTFDLNNINETVGGLIDQVNVTFGSGTLTINTGSNSYLHQGEISGTGGIIKQGTGEQTLWGSAINASPYSGSTSIQAGTLAVLLFRNTLDNSSSITVESGATLKVGGTSGLFTTNTITLKGNGANGYGALTYTTCDGCGFGTVASPITIGTGGGSIGVEPGSGNIFEITGTISGSTALTLFPNGHEIQINGTNSSYTGAITVSNAPGNGGTVSFNNANALGTTGANTTVNAGVALSMNGATALTIAEPLVLAGGSLVSVINSGDIWNGTVQLTADSSIQAEGLTINGVFSGTHSLAYSGESDTHYLKLTNTSNTFGGSLKTLSISNGNLAFSSALALGSASTTIALLSTGFGDEAHLEYTPASSSATISNPITIENGSVGIIGVHVDDVGSTLTLSGQITGSADLFEINGSSSSIASGNSGTVIISNTSNNFSLNSVWGMDIKSGSLRLGNSEVIPDAVRVTLPSDPFEGIFDVNGKTETIAALLGGEFNSSGDFNEHLVTLSDFATHTVAGTLILGANNTSGTFGGSIVGYNSGTNLVPVAQSGPGNIVKTGTGTITFNRTMGTGNENSYTGTTTINNGILEIGSVITNGLGTAAGKTTVNSGGTLLLTSGVIGLAEPLELNGTGYSSNGALRSTGTSFFAGPITLLGAATINAFSGTLTLSGTINGGFALTTAGSGALTFGGFVGNTSALTSLTTSGTGSTIISTNDTTNGIKTSGAQNYNNPLTLSGSDNTVTMTTTAGNIAFNNSVTGATSILKLDVTGNIAATSAVSLKGFNLAKGHWSQISTTLPAFSVTNNFQINGGTMPATSTTDFIRAANSSLTNIGTSGNPYLLTDVYGLQGVGSNSTMLANSYTLNNGIDATGTSTWNSGAGFVPIGTSGTPYGGAGVVFNGNGKLINGLTINRPGSSNIGLFASIAASTTVQNVGLVNAAVTGGSVTGILTGINAAAITSSFSTGSVTSSGANNTIGGLVGQNTASGTIVDAYSKASVTASSSTKVGGFVGENLNSTADAITHAYSTGAVSGSGATTVGGFAGSNVGSGSISYSFWDTATSGKSAGVGSDSSGTTTNLTGGCIGGGSCTNGGTANLSSQTTYTDAPYSWNFTDTWAMPSTGTGYPYLKIFARTVSGTAGSNAGDTVVLLADGIVVGSAVTTSGGNFTIYTTPELIVDGQNLLAFLQDATTKGNMLAVAPSLYESISNVAITVDNIQIDDVSSAFSNSAMASAKGAYVDTDILYTYSSNDITLSNGTNTTANLLGTSATTFTFDGSFIAIGGRSTSINLAGPVNLNNAAIATTNGITLGNTTLGITSVLNGGSGAISLGTVNGAFDLTLTTSGTASFGVVGGITPLSSLTVSSGTSGLTFNNVTTSGNQAYNNNGITLGSNTTLSSTSGTINSGGNIDGSSNTLTIDVPTGTTNTLSGIISNISLLTKLGAGTLILSGANTYSGNTTISAGILSAQHNTALGNTTGTTSVTTGATLDINGSSAAGGAVTIAENIAALQSTGVGALGALTASGSGADILSGTIFLNANTTIGGSGSGSLELSGVISDSTSRTLTKVGSSTIILSGINSYSSSTTISGGTLGITNANSLGDSASANINVANATLRAFASHTITSGRDIVLSAGGGTISVASGVTLTYNGVISGSSQPLTKSGSGTLSLGGVSTYSGGTNILAGTLQTTTGTNRLSTTTDMTIASGATFALSGGFAQSIDTLADNGGSGGTVSLGSATLTIGAGGGTAAFSGNFTGSGNITKSGAGTQTLSGTSDYTGITTLNAGTLAISSNANLGAGTGATNITFLGGALNVTANTTLSSTRGMTLSTGGGTINVDPTFTLTFDGVIIGSTTLTKSGTGTLSLGGTNTNTGTIAISAGTLSATSAGALGATAGATTIASGSTLELNNVAIGAEPITNNGGTIKGTGISSLTGGAITLGANSFFDSTGTLTVTGAIGDGASTFGITKNDTGTLILSGTNTYDGTTTISNGILTARSAAALGSTTGPTTVSSGATLNIDNNTSLNSESITLNGTGYTGTGGSLISTSGTNFASGTITLGTDTTINISSGAELELTGGMSGASRSMTKEGLGTLVYSGTAKTYTGATNINVGTFRLDASNQISDSSAVVMSTDNTAIFNLNGFSDTVFSIAGGNATGGAIQLGAGTLTVNLTNALATETYSGVISGSGGFTVDGTAGSVQIINGNNTYTGVTNILASGTLSARSANALGTTGSNTVVASGGTLDINGGVSALTITENLNIAGSGATGGAITGSNTGAIDILSGTITMSAASTIAGSGLLNPTGVISGAFALTKAGNGTVTLTNAANSFSGGVSISAGTLAIPTLNSGAGNSTIGTGNVTFGASSTGTLSYTGTTGSTARTITLSGPGIINVDDSTGATQVLTWNGAISGNFSLTKTGPDTLILGGAYNGSATTVNILGGKLQLGAANRFTGATDPIVSIASGAIFDMNSFSESVFALADNGVVAVDGSSVTMGNNATLTINGSSGTNTYSGGISGTGTSGLTKSGAGTQILLGTLTYPGATTISAGTLQIAGSSQSSNVSLSGGILQITSDASLGAVPGAFSATNITYAGGTIQALTTLSNAYTINANRGITLNAGGGTILTDPGLTLTYNGVFAATANAFTKSGAGTLNLGANSSGYTGAMTVSAGTLSATHDNALGTTAGGVAISAGATLNLNTVTIGAEAITLSGAGSTLSGTGASSLSGTVTFSAANGTISVDSAGQLSLTGILDDGASTRSLTKLSAGTLVLSNASNSWDGGTIISEGTVSINGIAASGTNSAIGQTGGMTLGSAGASGILLYTGNNTVTGINRALTIGGAGGGVVNISGSGSLTFTSGISGGGSFTKDGTGTYILSTTAATHTGSTIINDGTLRLAGSNLLPSTAVQFADIATAILDLQTSNVSDTVGTLTGGGSTGGNILLGAASVLTVGADNASLAAYAGKITGTGAASGAITKTGSGTQIFSSTTSDYTGGTTISQGMLSVTNMSDSGSAGALGAPTTNSAIQLAGSATNATLQYSGSGTFSSNRIVNLTATGGALDIAGTGALTLAGNITFNTGTFNLGLSGTGNGSGTISGVIGTTSGTVTKSGTTTWNLTGANSYTGQTIISAGTLGINTLTSYSGGASSLGNVASGNINIGATGVLKYIGSANTSSNRAVALTADGGSIAASGSGSFTLTGGISGTGFDLVLAGTGVGTINSNITTGAAATLTKSEAGTWTLSGTNTYTGATFLNAGTLSIAADLALGAAPGGATPGHLSFNGGTLQTTATFELNANRGISLDTSGGTIAPDTSTTLTYNGIIADTGTLTKTGAGTLDLGGASANTYTGASMISAGTLKASKASALGAGDNTAATGTTISSGATLNINNVAIGSEAITLNADTTAAVISGTLNASLSGTITISDASLAQGNFVTFTASGASDNLVLSGNITGGDPFTNPNIVTNVNITGSGLVALSGNNDYYGRTLVYGKVLATNANSFGQSGDSNFEYTTIVAGGQVQISGSSDTTPEAFYVRQDGDGTGALRLISGNQTLSGNVHNYSGVDTPTYNIDTGATLTISGPVVTGPFVKIGEGTLLFSNGTNNFSGVTINNGTLTITQAGALGTGSVTIAPSASATAILDLTALSNLSNTNAINVDSSAASSAAQLNTSTGITLTNDISLTGTANTFNVAANNTILSGNISGSAFTKTGTGTLTLSGTNTYTGVISISDGILEAASNSALGTTAGGVTVGTSGTLLLTGVAIGAESLSLNGTGYSSNGALKSTGTSSYGGAITLAGATTINALSGTLLLSNTIDGGFALTTAGAAALTFGGVIGATPLTSLATSSSGSTVIDTAAITTSGAQTYNNPVSSTLTNGTTTLDASDITFNNTLAWGTTRTLSLISDNNIVFTDANSLVSSGNSIALNAGGTITSTFDVNLSNFTLTSGVWSQIGAGTLPSFAISNDFSLTPSATTQFERFEDGAGTIGNPYQIVDLFGLQGLGSNATTMASSRYYIISADLDATATENWNAGDGWVPLGSSGTHFNAQLNGNGAVLSNVTIDRGTSDYVGFFGYIGSSGSVIGLGVTSNGTVAGQSNVGIFAGRNDGAMTQSYASGAVSSSSSGTAYLGGLVGYNNGTIANAYAQATVSAASGTATALGGLVGHNANTGAGVIDKTYAAGNVTNGGGAQGGLVGTNAGTAGTTVTNSFFDSDVCAGCSASAGGTGKTTAEMKTQATFTGAGWDFATPIWRIDGGVTYPYLNINDPATFRLVSGSLTIADGTTIRLLSNGVSKGTTTVTSNAFSFNIAFGDILDNANLLLFVDGGASLANTYAIAPVSNGNLTGLVMTVNNLRVDATATTASNSTLIAAKGSYSDTDIIYGGSGANLVLGSASGQNVTLTTSSGTAYTMGGTITTFSGATSQVNFGGALTINGSGITTTGSQSYGAVTLGATTALNAGSGNISFNNNSGVNGAFGLTLTTSGLITLRPIGGTTPLASLTISNDSAGITLSGSGNIRTSGNQSFGNNNIDLNDDKSFITSSGNVTGSGIIDGLDSYTLTFDVAGAGSAWSGVITDIAGLTKAGSGTLTLSGANAYTEDTNINGGILRLGASNVMPNSSAVILANVSGAAFDVDSFSDTIGALSNGGTNGGNITFNGGSLGISQSSNTTFAGNMTGTGGTLSKSGTGILTLSGDVTATFTSADIRVDQGTLRLGKSNVINDNNSVYVANNATFNLNDFSETIKLLYSNSGDTNGAVALGAGGTNTLTINYDDTGGAFSSNFYGIISGAGNLVKSGGDSLSLLGNNTYTGTTTINGGSLSTTLANSGFGDTSAITVNTGGTLSISGEGTWSDDAPIALNGNGYNLAGTDIGALFISPSTSTLTIANNITLESDALIRTSASFTNRIGILTGIIDGAGGLITGGVGITVLSNTSNSYNGSTTVDRGTLRLGASNVIPNASNLIIGNSSSSTFDVNGFSETIGSLMANPSGATISLGSGTLTATQGSDQIFTGVITGSGGFVKAGANSLTLNGNSSGFSGGVTLAAGTLSAGHNNALGTGTLTYTGGTLNASTADITLGNLIDLQGNFNINGSNNFTLSGDIGETGGARSLTKSGSSVITLSGTNTYTGTTTVNAGTLRLGGAAAISSSSALTLADVAGAVFDLNDNSVTIATLSGGGSTGGNILLGSGTLTVTQGSDQTYAGIISGTGGLTKAGISMLTLSNANTYTGTTTITAGTLRLSGSGDLANNSNVTLANVSGAILDLNGISQTIGSLSGGGSNGGNITLGSGTLTITQGSDQNYDGVISGSGNVVKEGNSVLTLSRVNTYTGTTTVNTGTLRFGVFRALPTNTQLTLASTGTLDLSTFGGGIGNLSGNGTITLSGFAGLDINQTSSTSFSGSITGTGDNIFLKGNGAGTAILTVTGTISADVPGIGIGIRNATLLVGSNNVINSSNQIYMDTSAKLQLANGVSDAIRGLDSSDSGSQVVLGTSSALTMNTNMGFTHEFWGLISGAGNLAKSGTDTQILRVSNNTYSGTTTINNGILEVRPSSGNGLGNTSSITVNSGGTLQLFGSGTLANTSTIFINGTGYTNLGALNIQSSITLNNNITLASNATILSTSTGTFNGVIGGSASLTTTGSGTIELGSANTYSGNTIINTGTLRLNVNDALPDTTNLTIGATGTATVDINGTNQVIANLMANPNTATLDINGGSFTATQNSNQTFSGTIDGGGGSFIKEGSAVLALSSSSNDFDNININAGILQLSGSGLLGSSAIVNAGASGTLDLNDISTTIASLAGSGSVLLGSGSLTTGDATNTTFSGVISEGGNLIKQGTGIFTLAGINTYSGTTSINDGSLQLSGSGQLSNSTAITVGATGIFDLNDVSDTIGSLAGSGSVTLGSATLSAGENNSSTTFSGVISSATNGVFEKVGTGTLLLSGINTFNGGLILSAGALTVGHNNALGTGTLTLNGGTLQSNATRTLANVFAVAIASQIGGGSSFNFTNTGTLSNTLTIANSASTNFLNNIGGTGGITQSVGTVTLSGTNTFSGAIVINGGTLNAESASALGNTTGSTTVNSGGTLAIINSTDLNAEPITLNNGALSVTGTSSLAGNLTLQSGTSNTISTSGAFTLDANINGAGALAMSGAGSYIVNGNIGNATPVTSLSLSSAATLLGSINTVNNQSFNGAITLGAHQTFASSAGAIAFNSTLNGAFDLTLSSNSTTTFAGIVGGGTALNSLSVNASDISIGGGAINTVENQTYNGVVTPSATTTFTTNTAGSATIAFNDGVSGSSNIAVTGNAAGTNSLIVDSGGTQHWSITAANGGGISGMSGYSGAFSFTNMRNITGSSGNDNFTLANIASSLAGSINGGAGNNTFTAFSVANTWNINGTDSAASVTGVTGGFINIQNLVGGDVDDHFIFANNASITGTINGGTPFTNNGTNILNFAAYSTAVTVNLIGDIFGGNTKNSGGSTIVSYSNIDNLIGNVATDNRINLPAGKSFSIVTYTGNRQGFIGDPTDFLNFTVNDNTPPAPTPAPTPTSTTTTSTEVAQVVQQPTTNNTIEANAPLTANPAVVSTETIITQNITEMTTQIEQTYLDDLNDTEINPHCGVSS